MQSRRTADPTNPGDLLLDRLELIEKIVATQCHRHRLHSQDAEDLASQVKLKLIENDYAVLRRFRGDCRWSTFLTTVIRNLCRDFLDRKLGRWRASITARNLGATAVELETLWRRDGYSLREAIEQMTRRDAYPLSTRQLLDLAEKLPERCRRRLLGGESIEELTTGGRVERRLERTERSATLYRVGTILAAALATLPEEDREVLELHYDQGLSFADIARHLGVGQRALYTCHERCLRRLRRFCGDEGISADAVAQVEGWKREQLEVDFARCRVKVV